MRAALVAAALVLALAHDASADRKRLVVVVAKGSSITSISRTDLKHCFMGDSTSIDGKTLVPFNSEPRTAERAGFDRGVLGMSPDEVGRYWVDRKVRGGSSAPRSLPSVMHVQKVVAKFPNAISYLPADQLTADVQPVRLDGTAYTDPRYPLFTE
ncbi:MAG TPA: hypothetical protein VIV58_23735 [Kofleriaceae bacterium]